VLVLVADWVRVEPSFDSTSITHLDGYPWLPSRSLSERASPHGRPRKLLLISPVDSPKKRMGQQLGNCQNGKHRGSEASNVISCVVTSVGLNERRNVSQVGS
jgi:hypothetical protein